MKILKVIILTVITAIFLASSATTGQAHDNLLRTIKVKIAADEEVRAKRGWENRLKERISRVSLKFEKDFNMTFEVLGIDTWDSKDDVYDLTQALIELQNEVNTRGVDIVIGFSGQRTGKDKEIKVFENLGKSLVFGDYLIVRELPTHNIFQRLGILIHETGHLFGAIHVGNVRSVMRPTTVKHATFTFDNKNKGIIRLARNMKFRGGPWKNFSSLSDEDVASLRSIYEEAAATNIDNNHARIALALTYQRDLGKAIQQLRGIVSKDRLNLNAHINLIDTLFAIDDYKKGEDALNEFLRIYPESAGGHTKLGIILYREGRLDDAIAEYRKALGINPEHLDARTNLKVALADQGRLDARIAEFHKSHREDPEDAIVHYNLGVELSKKGRLESAIAEYREAIWNNPEYAEAYNGLGYALYKQGRLKDAIASYRRALLLNPGLSYVHGNLGNALAELGRLDVAAVEFHKVLETKPGDALVHYSVGVELSEEERLDAAIVEYREAIRINPEYAEAYNGLGHAFYKQGRLKDAITAYRRAIEIDPENPAAHYNLGIALSDQARVDSSVVGYQKPGEIGSGDVVRYSLRGELRDREKLYEAIAEYRKALKVNKIEDRVHYKARYNLGNALAELGRLDEAIAEYRKALGIYQEDPDVYNNLGIALVEQGKPDEAVTEYQKAIEINPEDGKVYTNLGNALAELGRLDEAIAKYDKAIEHNPEDTITLTNLGATLAELGRLDEAIAKYRKVLKINPQDAEGNNNLAIGLYSIGNYREALLYVNKAQQLGYSVHPTFLKLLKAKIPEPKE